MVAFAYMLFNSGLLQSPSLNLALMFIFTLLCLSIREESAKLRAAWAYVREAALPAMPYH